MGLAPEPRRCIKSGMYIPSHDYVFPSRRFLVTVIRDGLDCVVFDWVIELAVSEGVGFAGAG